MNNIFTKKDGQSVAQSKKGRPFRVLCLDGGGMRGLYTATVLDTLAQRFSPNAPLDVGKAFDLIAGTSTGGILACGIAAGIPISKVISLYKKDGPKIFLDRIPSSMTHKVLWAIRNLNAPANQNDLLRVSLEGIFKAETVGELFRRRKIGLCIPSVNIATHEARVFKTAHDPKRNADDARTIVEVCLASSAAPMILPIAGVKNPHSDGQISYFADGGLWANNPVLVGLVEALHVSPQDQPIEIYSIGTCPPPSGAALLPEEARRGVLGWTFGVRALELSMDAQASGHQFMAKFLAEHLRRCGRQIDLLRFEQAAPSSEQADSFGLDNASPRACSTLIELGNADALKIYGKAIEAGNAYGSLVGLFKSMPQLST